MAFAIATLVTVHGRPYYKKESMGPSNVATWNDLYGEHAKILNLGYPAVLHNGDDYYPKLGEPVICSPRECIGICKIAQDKLNHAGYESIELTPEQCNINNVRVLNGDYFPIDMAKIQPLMTDEDFMNDLFGGKKRKHRRKTVKKKTNKKSFRKRI
jgi:hypothetical protein